METISNVLTISAPPLYPISIINHKIAIPNSLSAVTVR